MGDFLPINNLESPKRTARASSAVDSNPLASPAASTEETGTFKKTLTDAARSDQPARESKPQSPVKPKANHDSKKADRSAGDPPDTPPPAPDPDPTEAQELPPRATEPPRKSGASALPIDPAVSDDATEPVEPAPDEKGERVEHDRVDGGDQQAPQPGTKTPLAPVNSDAPTPPPEVQPNDARPPVQNQAAPVEQTESGAPVTRVPTENASSQQDPQSREESGQQPPSSKPTPSANQSDEPETTRIPIPKARDAASERSSSAAPAPLPAAASSSASTSAAPPASGTTFLDLQPQPAARGGGAPGPSASPSPSLTPTSVARGGGEEFAPQIVRGSLAMTRSTGGAMTMRLEPESLGSLRIQMSMSQGRVSVQFHAETAQARGLLTQHVETLRTAMESQGLKLDTVQIHTLQRPGTSGSGGQEQSQSQNGSHHHSKHDAGGQQSRGHGDTAQREAQYRQAARQFQNPSQANTSWRSQWNAVTSPGAPMTTSSTMQP